MHVEGTEDLELLLEHRVLRDRGWGWPPLPTQRRPAYSVDDSGLAGCLEVAAELAELGWPARGCVQHMRIRKGLVRRS
jgi:hypothetical protein